MGLIGYAVGPLVMAFESARLAVMNHDKEPATARSASGQMVEVIMHARGIPAKYKAVTQGHRIYVRGGDISVTTLTHELRHVAQIERTGRLRNAAEYGYWLARVGYNKHPLEQEARRAAGQPER
jgi:hypothetical protein